MFPLDFTGSPTPWEENVGDGLRMPDPDDQAGNAFIPASTPFRTYSSLVIPTFGEISLGVGNGQIPLSLPQLGTSYLYPSRLEGTYGNPGTHGEAVATGASIVYFHQVPGDQALADPMTVEVTIDVVAGTSPYVLYPGSVHSAAEGLVGVTGEFFLTLHGTNPIDGTKTKRFIFLDHARSQSWMARCTPKLQGGTHHSFRCPSRLDCGQAQRESL